MCHTDQTDTWAAEQTVTWWGGEPTPHYGEALAAGRTGTREALGPLVELVNDTGQPAIARATALEQLRQYGALGMQAIVSATTDENPLVRSAAVGGLERLPPQRRIQAVAPLLDDPILDVRVAAARVLASVPRDQVDASLTTILQSTGQEFVDAQMASADMPASRLNLGVLYAYAGRLDEAEQEYVTALRMDPHFLPARFNLVNLYNSQGRNDEAEAMLRTGIEQIPEEGELHYSLGLLLAEMERLDEAAVSLGRAADLIPERARPRYNYGLALQRLGRLDEAEAALVQAHEIDPLDSDMLVALVNLLMNRSEWERARDYAVTLRRLNPTAPAAQQLLNEIQIRRLRSR
jgi:tetratricopeptide (TPR) repeat protein